MKLMADKVQGGYVLNGTKFWITNAHYATLWSSMRRRGRGPRDHDLHHREGHARFSVGQKIDKMGMRGSPPASCVQRLRGP
jgi:isovaleryl-CoA dehydrogenase